MKKILTWLLGLSALCCLSTTASAAVTIQMYLTQGDGSQPIGTISAADTKYGLLLTPNLTNLSPGLHGLHIHEKPSCADAGMAAGDHLDPQQSHQHAGPYADAGHLGDMPVLIVDKNGKAFQPILAPRLKLADIQGHALMIHENNDNYTDTPKLGGSGARIACGVIGNTNGK